MFPIFEYFMDGTALYERMVIPVCREFALTYMEFTVLMFLYNNPQYDTAAQIVSVRQLTKSHVSMTVKSLRERRLIEGIYFHGNHKTLHLRLTPAAEPVIKAGSAAQEAFGTQLVKGMSQEEIKQLIRLKERIHANMKWENL